LGITPELSLQ